MTWFTRDSRGRIGMTLSARDLVERLRVTTRAAEMTVESDGETYRTPAPLDQCNVMSSDIRASHGELSEFESSNVRHIPLLDIDYPVHVIESSTPGHHHLILEVPYGVPHDAYMRLLQALSDAGVIQPGYARASINRGHSDLRLPWVTKDRTCERDSS